MQKQHKQPCLALQALQWLACWSHWLGSPKAITIIFQPNTPTISNLQTTKCRCWAQKVCAMAYCSIFCRDSAWFIVTQWWCLSAPKQLDDCFILSQNPYLRSLCKRLRERSNSLHRIDVRTWFSFICLFIAAPTNCLEFFMVFTNLKKQSILFSAAMIMMNVIDSTLLKNVQWHVNASVMFFEKIPTSSTEHNIPCWWERLDVLDALLHRSNPPELVHFIPLPHDSGDMNWLSKNQNKKSIEIPSHQLINMF